MKKGFVIGVVVLGIGLANHATAQEQKTTKKAERIMLKKKVKTKKINPQLISISKREVKQEPKLKARDLQRLRVKKKVVHKKRKAEPLRKK